VPLPEQLALFHRIRRWLRPGGWFLSILGHGAVEGWEENWLSSDVRMFWSHADAETYRRWLTASSFDVVEQKFIPEGDSGHELFLARARGQSRRIAPT
jgi:hypothetical protein